MITNIEKVKQEMFYLAQQLESDTLSEKERNLAEQKIIVIVNELLQQPNGINILLEIDEFLTAGLDK